MGRFYLDTRHQDETGEDWKITLQISRNHIHKWLFKVHLDEAILSPIHIQTTTKLCLYGDFYK